MDEPGPRGQRQAAACDQQYPVSHCIVSRGKQQEWNPDEERPGCNEQVHRPIPQGFSRTPRHRPEQRDDSSGDGRVEKTRVLQNRPVVVQDGRQLLANDPDLEAVGAGECRQIERQQGGHARDNPPRDRPVVGIVGSRPRRQPDQDRDDREIQGRVAARRPDQRPEVPNLCREGARTTTKNNTIYGSVRPNRLEPGKAGP